MNNKDFIKDFISSVWFLSTLSVAINIVFLRSLPIDKFLRLWYLQRVIRPSTTTLKRSFKVRSSTFYATLESTVESITVDPTALLQLCLTHLVNYFTLLLHAFSFSSFFFSILSLNSIRMNIDRMNFDWMNSISRIFVTKAWIQYLEFKQNALRLMHWCIRITTDYQSNTASDAWIQQEHVSAYYIYLLKKQCSLGVSKR